VKKRNNLRIWWCIWRLVWSVGTAPASKNAFGTESVYVSVEQVSLRCCYVRTVLPPNIAKTQRTSPQLTIIASSLIVWTYIVGNAHCFETYKMYNHHRYESAKKEMMRYVILLSLLIFIDHWFRFFKRECYSRVVNIKHNFADMTLYSEDEIDFILEYCCTS